MIPIMFVIHLAPDKLMNTLNTHTKVHNIFGNKTKLQGSWHILRLTRQSAPPPPHTHTPHMRHASSTVFRVPWSVCECVCVCVCCPYA